jgi:S1-C subfamily serine protease
VGSAGTADLLQEVHEGSVVRKLLHQRQCQVQAAAWVRMLIRHRIACWLVAAIVVTSTAFPATAQTAFGYGNWRGFYTTNADDKFKACFVEAEYSSGDQLQFWLTPEQEMYFSLKQKGSADPNQRTARIWVDDATPSQAVIEHVDPLIIFYIGSLKKKIAKLFESIRMGNVLSIEIGGSVHKFSLRGTYGALSELVGCANLVRMGQPPQALVLQKRAPAATPSASAPAPSPVVAPAPKSTTLASSASAFAVSANGHLLTNAHAIEECRELKAGNDQGNVATARVVAIDKRNDLALLAVKDIDIEPARFRKGPLRLGEAVFAYGFPLRTLLASSGNFTAGMVSALVGMKDDSIQLQISAPVQPGNSGGPLLDAKGAVVGVIVGKLNAIGVAERTGDIPQNVNFAIKGAIALTFLEAHGVTPGMANGVNDISTADVADIGKRISLRLDCFK